MIPENPDQFLKPSVVLKELANLGHSNLTSLFSSPIIQTNLLFPRWFEKLGIYHNLLVFKFEVDTVLSNLRKLILIA